MSADRGTVWVNDADGACIGRFSKRFGLDVHVSGPQQLAGQAECLLCTHGPADHVDWQHFVDAMRWHHGVRVLPQLPPWS